MKRVDKAPELSLPEGWDVSEYALNYDDFMTLFALHRMKNIDRAVRVLSSASYEVVRFVVNHPEDFFGGEYKLILGSRFSGRDRFLEEVKDI